MVFEREVHLVLIACFWIRPTSVRMNLYISWAANMSIMFLEEPGIIDWDPINKCSSALVVCTQRRLWVLSNSCQFLVVLALAVEDAAVEALLVCCRCDGST